MREEWGDGFETLLEEDTLWMDSDWVKHDIKGMDIHYVINVVQMLNKRMKRYEVTYKIPTLMVSRIEKAREENPEYFL